MLDPVPIPSQPPSQPLPDPGAEAPRRPRLGPGEDPLKRDQILDGAFRAFMERGFDRASMEDVRREAGVSKGTLYVYFGAKEELFAALMERERGRLFAGLDATLEGGLPTAEALRRFGRLFAGAVLSEPVVRAQRIVVGIAPRMPEMAARFFEGGAGRTLGVLRRFLDREVAAGRLAVPDTGLAAQQFMELATAGLWRQRLFGVAPLPPAEAEVAARVDGAVALMMAAYGVRGTP